MVDETEFDIMEADDESRREDDLMLFHECPNCNFRCNCSDQPCSCCEADESDDQSCPHQDLGRCNSSSHKKCADSFEREDGGTGCYRVL